MHSLPSEVRFRLAWRDYQARVLGELEAHLSDQRLHVVAAPGSGKTALGLEVIRRLNRPVLILAPTLTIRNQWVERFAALFLGDSRVPRWVSTDLADLQFITVATYQALHAARGGEDEPLPGEAEEETRATDAAPATPRGTAAELIERLRLRAVRTVVLDEAHHLRTEWWKSLTEVVAGLDAPSIVALTATPPYDVAHHEWQRYEELCGPVDTEISVPELVARGDLCPHQDYVHVSAPTPEESQRLLEFRRHVLDLLVELSREPALSEAVAGHPWVREPSAHEEAILEDPAYASSMLVFLARLGKPVSPQLATLLGVAGRALPDLDLEWLERLLTGCLVTDTDSYGTHRVFMRELAQRLRRIGALERRRVVLRNPTAAARLLTASLNKLQSIGDIVRLEHEALGSGLRAVVLTDYIRRQELPDAPGEEREPQQIGVVPIFERLRRSGPAGARLGILSGALVVLPSEAVPALRAAAVEAGFGSGDVTARTLPHDDHYCSVEISGAGNAGIVGLVTRLFARGDVTVLVGTKALLGEGWDAPSVNCLILATVVGSYMLSNQMRGRAIRVDPSQPDKTANVWHLVTVEPDAPPGEDFDTVVRRFQAFTGVAYDRPVIENGFGRLALGSPPFSRAAVLEINERMARKALDRPALGAAWRAGLAGGVRLVEVISAPARLSARPFVFANTLRAVMWQGGMWGLFVWSQTMKGAGRSGNAWTGLKWGAMLGAAVAVPWFLKAGWLLLRHGSLESSLRQVGEAVIATLAGIGVLERPSDRLSVRAERGDMGSVKCWLEGGTSYEQSLFLTAMRELLDPIENPRYLLVRRPLLWRGLREDYHCVPSLIGRRKEHAELLARMWRKHVGRVELVYTRSAEGRRVLLRARGRSLATVFQPRSERRNCWQ